MCPVNACNHRSEEGREREALWGALRNSENFVASSLVEKLSSSFKDETLHPKSKQNYREENLNLFWPLNLHGYMQCYAHMHTHVQNHPSTHPSSIHPSVHPSNHTYIYTYISKDKALRKSPGWGLTPLNTLTNIQDLLTENEQFDYYLVEYPVSTYCAHEKATPKRMRSLQLE